MAQYKFARTEKKFLIPASIYEDLRRDVAERMDPDGDYPEYTLCNLYYDSAMCELARRSVEKPVFKEKLRVRSYGVPTPDTKVYVETKTKFKGVVYKRRVGLPWREAREFLDPALRTPPHKDSQITREIEYFAGLFCLEPKVFLAYDRIAFKGREDKSLRLTFDENIRYRLDRLDLCEGDDGTPLITDGTRIMEVKAEGALPPFLLELLARYEIRPGSFSKYGKIYEKNREQMERQP